MLAEQLFHGAGAFGRLGELDREGIGDAAATQEKKGDRILFRGRLEDYRVEILDTTRQLWNAATYGVYFFEATVQGGGALEIQIGAGLLAIAERPTAGEAPPELRKLAT